MKQTFISGITISHNRAHIKDTNIPVDLIVGRSVREVKGDYPWLTQKQIEGALIFAQSVIRSQKFTDAPSRSQN